jgi:hypothetical protein
MPEEGLRFRWSESDSVFIGAAPAFKEVPQARQNREPSLLSFPQLEHTGMIEFLWSWY